MFAGTFMKLPDSELTKSSEICSRGNVDLNRVLTVLGTSHGSTYTSMTNHSGNWSARTATTMGVVWLRWMLFVGHHWRTKQTLKQPISLSFWTPTELV